MKRKVDEEEDIIVNPFLYLLDTTLYIVASLFEQPFTHLDLKLNKKFDTNADSQLSIRSFCRLMSTCHYMYKTIGGVYYENYKEKLMHLQYCTVCEESDLYTMCFVCETSFCIGCVGTGLCDCEECGNVACPMCIVSHGRFESCEECEDEYCWDCAGRALSYDLCEGCQSSNK